MLVVVFAIGFIYSGIITCIVIIIIIITLQQSCVDQCSYLVHIDSTVEDTFLRDAIKALIADGGK